MSDSKRESSSVEMSTKKRKFTNNVHMPGNVGACDARESHKKSSSSSSSGSLCPPPKTLEELACRIIEILQTHGMVSAKTILDAVKVDSRYVQAVLGVLHAKPLVTMIRRKDGKEEMYLYRGIFGNVF